MSPNDANRKSFTSRPISWSQFAKTRRNERLRFERLECRLALATVDGVEVNSNIDSEIVDTVPPQVDCILSPAMLQHATETPVVEEFVSRFFLELTELVPSEQADDVFRMVEAGDDGVFDSIDDRPIEMTVDFSSAPRHGTVRIHFDELTDGLYRFTLTDRLLDFVGNPSVETTLAEFRVEVIGDFLYQASTSFHQPGQMPVTRDQSGQFFRSDQLAVASLDYHVPEYWRIRAKAGDQISAFAFERDGAFTTLGSTIYDSQGQPLDGMSVPEDGEFVIGLLRSDSASPTTRFGIYGMSSVFEAPTTDDSQMEFVTVDGVYQSVVPGYIEALQDVAVEQSFYFSGVPDRAIVEIHVTSESSGPSQAELRVTVGELVGETPDGRLRIVTQNGYAAISVVIAAGDSDPAADWSDESLTQYIVQAVLLLDGSSSDAFGVSYEPSFWHQERFRVVSHASLKQFTRNDTSLSYPAQAFLRVVNAGPDGQFETGDDQVIPISVDADVENNHTGFLRSTTIRREGDGYFPSGRNRIQFLQAGSIDVDETSTTVTLDEFFVDQLPEAVLESTPDPLDESVGELQVLDGLHHRFVNFYQTAIGVSQPKEDVDRWKIQVDKPVLLYLWDDATNSRSLVRRAGSERNPVLPLDSKSTSQFNVYRLEHEGLYYVDKEFIGLLLGPDRYQIRPWTVDLEASDDQRVDVKVDLIYPQYWESEEIADWVLPPRAHGTNTIVSVHRTVETEDFDLDLFLPLRPLERFVHPVENYSTYKSFRSIGDEGDNAELRLKLSETLFRPVMIVRESDNVQSPISSGLVVERFGNTEYRLSTPGSWFNATHFEVDKHGDISQIPLLENNRPIPFDGPQDFFAIRRDVNNDKNWVDVPGDATDRVWRFDASLFTGAAARLPDVIRVGDRPVQFTGEWNHLGTVRMGKSLAIRLDVNGHQVLILSKKQHFNFLNAEDVNNDGRVTPLDVLLVINRLERVLSSDSTSSRFSTEPTVSDHWLFDVNADDSVSPIDALRIINRLERDWWYTHTTF